MKGPLIIAGCTATGKSAVAQVMAERAGAAIVSADSMLVYRGMDVGTAKPTPEERSRVRYIGLDCVDPGERFSTGAWLECVREGLASLPPGTPVVVAGGTGLYIKALTEGLDAPGCDRNAREAARAIFEKGGLAALQAEVARLGLTVPPGDAANPRRLLRAIEKAMVVAGGSSPPDPRWPNAVWPSPRANDPSWPSPRANDPSLPSPRANDPNLPSPRANDPSWPSPRANDPSLPSPRANDPSWPSPRGLLTVPPARAFLLSMDRDALNARIEKRAREMFENGIVEEAVRIFGKGVPSETATGAIGYAEALAFAQGGLSLEEAIARVATRTRQLAKRQRTWFRHQFSALTVEVEPTDTAESIADRIAAMA